MSQEILASESAQQVKLDLKKNGPKGTWSIDVEIESVRRMIPVYHIREDSHKESIAKALISGEPVAAFGVGNYGLAIGVEDPRRGRNPNAWRFYYDFKPERPASSKIPILLPPKYWDLIIDKKKIHPKFRSLISYEKLYRTYEEGVIFHIVAPTYDRAPHINEQAFVTAANGKKSVSAFYWRDPDLDEIADLAIRFDHQVLIGISSFNDHGENPAYNFEEVINYILRKRRVPFNYVVRDEIGESIGVRSSHPQFEIPRVNGPELWVVVREGSRSTPRFLEATGLPYHSIDSENITVAPMDHPFPVDLDKLVDKVHERTTQDYKRRKGKA